MKIRLEGTRSEIRHMEQVLQVGLSQMKQMRLKSISKFYPNRDDENGREYIELEKNVPYVIQ
jgi:hypothetical protein